MYICIYMYIYYIYVYICILCTCIFQVNAMYIYTLGRLSQCKSPPVSVECQMYM